jgi:NitT/TauT family transport system ATP-binding protein
MKQRVGIARALAVEPEVLLMDEPFSQVDALTAESLRADVIDIWALRGGRLESILMVSHDIKEVAYMADRIVVLGANPGQIRTIVANHLPRPRDYQSAELLGLVNRLHEIITGHEMPDEPEPPPGAIPEYEPLPEVSTSELAGLLEYLDAHGGRQELFRISADLHLEFGRLIAVVKAAEILDFVDTPKQTVVLTPIGQRFVRALPDDRKVIWREQLLKLRLFKSVHDILVAKGRPIDEELVLELIVLNMPQERYEEVFNTFIRWARFGNLFAYEEDTQRISLQ